MNLQEDLNTFIIELRSSSGFSEPLFKQLIEDTSEEVALKMAARFHQTLGESLVAIKDGLLRNECEPVWRGAHKVAGTAALLGFSDLGSRSKELVKQLRNLTDDPAEIQEKNQLMNEADMRSEINGYIQMAEAIYESMAQACPGLSSYY